MPRLLIANECPYQVFGVDAEFCKSLSVWALRLLWYIKDDDIVVLPIQPEIGYVEYIAELTKTRYESLRIIIAPKGKEDYLSADRLTNIELHHAVNNALAGRNLEAILTLTPDAAVVKLARSLGVESCVAGAGFASQDGSVLANSKAVFRAIAAGTQVPIPAGTVTHDRDIAEETIAEMMLCQKIPVMIKKDFGQGCRGNEVLTSVGGLVPNGGRRGLILTTRDAIKTYIAENWDWLTNNGHDTVIIERYFPGSRAIFAEYYLTDCGVEFAGLGEMLAAPIADGQVIPPVDLPSNAVAGILDGGYRLSSALHAIGYRGMVSADAIVTPNNEVFFTEYNGRITGSTHIYSIIGASIVGKGFIEKRILLERRGWTAPSFQVAVQRLKDSKLAFNHETKKGIILSGVFSPTHKVISYTIIAENLPAAIDFEEQLHRVSPRAVEVTV